MQTTYPASNAAARTAPRTTSRKSARATSQAEREARPIDLRLTMPEAVSVAVAGSFNGWDPARNPMQKDGTGTWKTTLKLPPGMHEYRFVVDGDWISDPAAAETVENPFGQTNSLLRV